MAERRSMPPHQVWLLEPPEGGHTTLLQSEHALTSAQPLIEAGWLLTGPYTLDPEAGVAAAREYLAAYDRLMERRRQIH